MDDSQPLLTENHPNHSRRLEWVAVGLTMMIGLAVITGTVAWKNHSAAALVRVNPRGLVADTTTRLLGDVTADLTVTFAFRVRNQTDHPIRIQGSQTSCTRTVVEGIPRVIPAEVRRTSRVPSMRASCPDPFSAHSCFTPTMTTNLNFIWNIQVGSLPPRDEGSSLPQASFGYRIASTTGEPLVNQLILRVSSSVMATAAVMLMGVAIVLATPGTSHAQAPPVCPAEPVNGNCAGTCTKAGQTCQDVTVVLPDKSEQPGCLCLPPPPTTPN